MRLPQLGPRGRKIVRYAGIAVVTLIVFVFALQMSFPYDKVKRKIEESLADKYDVAIGSVERGFVPGRVYFNNISVRTRPTKPEEPVTTFLIKRLEVDVGILPLLHGVASVDIDAQIEKAHIAGNISLSKKKTSIDLHGKSLPGIAMPMRAILGLPMTGKLEFAVDLTLPNARNKQGKVAADWSHASGHVDFACPGGCTFGDGKTKLKPLLKNTRNQVMVGDGIDFGQVNLDSLVAKAVFTPADGSKPGKLEVTKFDVKSNDGELKVDFLMTLAQNLDDSMVTGCLRFKGSDALLKREPKTYAAIQTTGAELRADGLFHIKLTDRLKDMRRLNMQCGPGTQTNMDGNFSNEGNAQPHLEVKPDEPIHPPPPPVTPTAPAANEQPPAPPPVRPPPGPEGEVPPVGSAMGAAGAAPTGTAAPVREGREAPQPPNEAVPPEQQAPTR